MAYHAAYMREGRSEVRNRNTLRSEEALMNTLEGAPVHVTRRLLRAMKTGAWLTVHSSTVNGMELGAQEFRDALFLKYVLKPLDKPKLCDGCNTAFSI